MHGAQSDRFATLLRHDADIARRKQSRLIGLTTGLKCQFRCQLADLLSTGIHTYIHTYIYIQPHTLTMFPSQSTIANVFASPMHSPVTMTGEAPAKQTPFPAWNVIDETKKEASRELNAASQKAQAATGKIEPWSAKYYAACTFGGLLACVSIQPVLIADGDKTKKKIFFTDSYCRA